MTLGSEKLNRFQYKLFKVSFLKACLKMEDCNSFNSRLGPHLLRVPNPKIKILFPSKINKCFRIFIEKIITYTFNREPTSTKNTSSKGKTNKHRLNDYVVVMIKRIKHVFGNSNL